MKPTSRQNDGALGLDDTAVEEGLQRLSGWERCGNQLAKTFVRADFARAMVFVNEVAAATEVAGHHPDIDMRCRRLLPRHYRTPWPVAWPARWKSAPAGCPRGGWLRRCIGTQDGRHAADMREGGVNSALGPAPSGVFACLTSLPSAPAHGLRPKTFPIWARSLGNSWRTAAPANPSWLPYSHTQAGRRPS
jgi:hypothetical protein